MNQAAHVSRTPTDIIADFTWFAPVDVHGMAAALGLVVKEQPLPDDISGRIQGPAWLSGSYRITINSRHSPTRRRFTLAHEISHYVLHRDLIGDGIEDDGLYRSAKGEPIERQANQYAATLLMPAPLVRDRWRAGIKSFPAMAAEFDVSVQVAEIRMKELRLQ